LALLPKVRMICFRDMTFCPFWETCAGATTCGRALTPEVVADAHRWWGNDKAPISQYTQPPTCHVMKDAGEKPLANRKH
jgi:hypothetical protein